MYFWEQVIFFKLHLILIYGHYFEKSEKTVWKTKWKLCVTLHIAFSPLILKYLDMYIQYQFNSVIQSCPTLCDPMNCSTPALPVHHQLPEFTQTHVHRVHLWLWCWEGLGAGGEGDDRGRDSWMASPTHGHGFGWTLAVGDGQGGLACCSSWGHKESDTTEQLKRTEVISHDLWAVLVC